MQSASTAGPSIVEGGVARGRGGNCELCGRPLHENQAAHRDHIVQRHWGGTDGPHNLRWVHAQCNLNRPLDGAAQLPLIAAGLTFYASTRRTNERETLVRRGDVCPDCRYKVPEKSTERVKAYRARQKAADGDKAP